MNAGRFQMTHEDRLRGILREWRKAQADPAVKVPATFALLLEAAALALSDQDARQADAMNRLEAETQSRAHDRTTWGNRLKAGA